MRDLVNDAGGVQNKKAYDAFGRVTAETNPAVDTAFGFTGRLLDDETGLQNNLYRCYDPATGRWINEDPIGFAAGDANLNRYVGSESTRFVDPLGLAGGDPGPDDWRKLNEYLKVPQWLREEWSRRAREAEAQSEMNRWLALEPEAEIDPTPNVPKLTQGPTEPKPANETKRRNLKDLNEMDELARKRAGGDRTVDERFNALLYRFGSSLAEWKLSIERYKLWSQFNR